MARADRVPFARDRPLVAVRARLNGQARVILAVDTGAELTVISRTTARDLGFDLARPPRVLQLAGVGQSPPVPVVRLNRLQVGASSVTGLDVCVFDVPGVIRADGLLGLNFLRRFRVTFEFDSGTLVLRERTTR